MPIELLSEPGGEEKGMALMKNFTKPAGEFCEEMAR